MVLTDYISVQKWYIFVPNGRITDYISVQKWYIFVPKWSHYWLHISTEMYIFVPKWSITDYISVQKWYILVPKLVYFGPLKVHINTEMVHFST